MRSLYIVEATRKGGEHASFNAAMIRVLMNHPGIKDLDAILYCERTHRDAIIGIAPEVAQMKWRELSLVDGFTRSFVKKFFVELSVISRILREARKRRGTVFLLSVFPNVLACILLLQSAFKRVPLHVVLHGEIESLIIREKQGIHREGFWTKLAFLHLFSGKWPICYVLGERIKARLLARFPDALALRKFRVINHFYIFGDTGGAERDVRNPPFRIGFVGTGRMAKGIDGFFYLASLLSSCFPAGLLEFVVVGGIERRARKFQNEWVHVLADRPAGLESSEYFQALESLDCAVFLNRQNYAFTASGTVLDIISKNVEIFSVPNYYLSDLARWDSENGIKFFEDIDAMAAEIRRRIDGGEGFSRYRYAQIKHYHSAKSQQVAF